MLSDSSVSVNTCPVSAWEHKSSQVLTQNTQVSMFTRDKSDKLFLSVFRAQVSVSDSAQMWVAASSDAWAQPPGSRCEAGPGLESLIKRWRRERGVGGSRSGSEHCSIVQTVYFTLIAILQTTRTVDVLWFYFVTLIKFYVDSDSALDLIGNSDSGLTKKEDISYLHLII